MPYFNPDRKNMQKTNEVSLKVFLKPTKMILIALNCIFRKVFTLKENVWKKAN